MRPEAGSSVLSRAREEEVDGGLDVVVAFLEGREVAPPVCQAHRFERLQCFFLPYAKYMSLGLRLEFSSL